MNVNEIIYKNESYLTFLPAIITIKSPSSLHFYSDRMRISVDLSLMNFHAQVTVIVKWSNNREVLPKCATGVFRAVGVTNW